MQTFLKRIVVRILTLEARAAIRRHKPHIVAVTGSVGKTSTKDAIYAVLSERHFVRRSDKSFNSEVGLPLAILGLPNAWHNPVRWVANFLDGLIAALLPGRYPEWLVLEVGADRPNDIRRVAAWLPVDIAVITRLPEVPVHVEYFSSPEEVAEEKASLIAALKPSGTLILWGDDERTRALAARTSAPVITFGFSEHAMMRAEECRLLLDEEGRPAGMEMHVAYRGERARLAVRGTVGAYALGPALAALAVGATLGKTLVDAARSVEERYAAPPGRMRLIRGIKNAVVIDDTYNSSPAAAEAALGTLSGMPKGRGARRIAVLGDMLELGRFSAEEHRKMGALAAKHATLLITVGFRARNIAQAALDAGLPESKILQYEDSAKAGEELASMMRAGDCVLVKGSQSMRMERVVEAIMEHPEQAKELLVRQEREWKKR